MQLTNQFSRKIALGLIALMLTIIPNLKVYSALGNYQSDSAAITANEQYQLEDKQEQGAYITGAAVSAAVVVVMLVVAASDSGEGESTGEEEEEDSIYGLMAMRGAYDAQDFSTFDN